MEDSEDPDGCSGVTLSVDAAECYCCQRVPADKELEAHLIDYTRGLACFALRFISTGGALFLSGHIR